MKKSLNSLFLSPLRHSSKSYFISKLESILHKEFIYYYDKRKNSIIKYRVKIPYTHATKNQLRLIAAIPCVFEVKNIESSSEDFFYQHYYQSIAIYLKCKISQIQK